MNISEEKTMSTLKLKQLKTFNKTMKQCKQVTKLGKLLKIEKHNEKHLKPEGTTLKNQREKTLQNIEKNKETIMNHILY